MNRNLLYANHESRGALLRPQDELQPLLGYGDVPGEYQAANEDVVLFDETDRGLVRVDGAEANDFLQRLLANEILPLEEGQGNRNLLLTGKGKILFDFDLERTADGFRLSTPPGAAPGLIQGLDMYLFGEAVELIDATETYAPLLVCGPNAAAMLSKLDLPRPEVEHQTLTTEFEGATLRVTQVSPFGSPAYRLDAGPEKAPALWDRLVDSGARAAGRIVADILRVESCSALWGEDIDDSIYPQEARLDGAFNLSKGCYIGQEVVAKIDTYGGINKRLCALTISHDDPIPAGTRLYRFDEERDEWRDLGVVTTWAYSFRQDCGQVLAYIKRRHQEPGTTFRVGEEEGVEATLLE